MNSGDQCGGLYDPENTDIFRCVLSRGHGGGHRFEVPYEPPATLQVLGPRSPGPLERLVVGDADRAYVAAQVEWRQRAGAMLRACAETAGLPANRLGSVDDELARIVDDMRRRCGAGSEDVP